MLVTVAREEAVEDGKNPTSILIQVLYICYLINFREKSVLALFDLGSKLNAVYPTFAKELGLFIGITDAEA